MINMDMELTHVETQLGEEDSQMESDYGDGDSNWEIGRECDMTKIVGLPLIYHVLDTGQSMDTVITLSDGKLGAHRLVLAAASTFLEELLLEQDAKTTASLILPDISKHTMELMLTLAYTGMVNFTLDDEEDLFSAMTALFFGTGFDVSIHRLPPRLKPKQEKKPPVKKPLRGEVQASQDCESDADDEDEALEPEGTRPVVQASSSSSTARSAVASKSRRSSAAAISFQCTSCDRSFRREAQLELHIDKSHKSKILATFGEVRILTYCDGCDTQWKTLDRAQKCLHSHGLVRCWACFDVFDRVGIKSHYLLHHTDESSVLDCHNTFVGCRWCDRKLNIKAGVAKLTHHSIGHVPQGQEAKGAGSEPMTLEEDAEEGDTDATESHLCEATTVDGSKLFLRYQTLTGDETLELEKFTTESRPLPPVTPAAVRKYIARPASEKKRFEIIEVLKVQPKILLSRLPKGFENKIFGRSFVPVTPPSTEEEHSVNDQSGNMMTENDQSGFMTDNDQSGFMTENDQSGFMTENDQSTSMLTENDQSGFMSEIDSSAVMMKKIARSVVLMSEIDQSEDSIADTDKSTVIFEDEDFIPITPPSSGDLDAEDCLPEISFPTKDKDAENRSAKNKKRCEKRKRRLSQNSVLSAETTATMVLHTKRWGSLNVLMEHLTNVNSGSATQGQGHCHFPKNATLVIGEYGIDIFWRELAKKLEGATTESWRIKCRGTLDPFSDIFDYLKKKNRYGMINSEEFTQSLEIVLFPLTDYNYAKLIKQVTSLPSKLAQANQPLLIALLIRPKVAKAVALTPPPSEATTDPPIKKRRGRKRRMSSCGTPTPKPTPVSDRQTRRSLRKRPRVLPLLKLDRDLDLSHSGTGARSDSKFVKCKSTKHGCKDVQKSHHFPKDAEGSRRFPNDIKKGSRRSSKEVEDSRRLTKEAEESFDLFSKRAKYRYLRWKFSKLKISSSGKYCSKPKI